MQENYKFNYDLNTNLRKSFHFQFSLHKGLATFFKRFTKNVFMDSIFCHSHVKIMDADAMCSGTGTKKLCVATCNAQK